MNIFDNKGMMLFPNPKKEKKENDKLIILKECFCSNGHNLINKRVNFNGFDGIYLKVLHNSKEGFVGLSPVFGDKSRIFVDIDVKKGDVLNLFCPHCNTPLAVYSSCSCGEKLIALFTTPKLEFANCIGICNKVDCVNAEIISENQLITISMIDPSVFY
jgi:hypothetical protein